MSKKTKNKLACEKEDLRKNTMLTEFGAENPKRTELQRVEDMCKNFKGAWWIGK